MKALSELKTITEVDDRIAEICRQLPISESQALLQRAAEMVGHWLSLGPSFPLPEQSEPKLNAVCQALMHRARIEKKTPTADMFESA